MKINWDRLFEGDCESMPNCPWIDHEPYNDDLTGDDDDEN